MKDYSELLEIAEASATANNDETLRKLIEELHAMTALDLHWSAQNAADRMGERILELL